MPTTTFSAPTATTTYRGVAIDTVQMHRGRHNPIVFAVTAADGTVAHFVKMYLAKQAIDQAAEQA